MDLYITSLLLGATGLGVMALSGLGSRGHGTAGHGARGHGGHGHVHLHAHGHAAHGSANSHSLTAGGRAMASRTFWSLTSPRVLFSFFLGFGSAGLLVRPFAGGVVLAASAVLGGVALERLLVSPLWNFSMRFASTPAATLESAVSDEATAVTAFDANGQGIVSIEVDGQVVQILATLQPDHRALAGPRIRAGQRVRIDEVDAERNRCTVSLL
ncbi:MAG: hypothetical protein ACHQWU_05400 [Gemmatimonadales bacterium]